jgi:hypothetical protein
MRRDIDGGPLVGADRDLGWPTINAKKYRRRAPWWVLMEIREHPPSMLRTVDGGPPGGC